MKLKDAVKIFDEKWVRKPTGFRVHFQKRVDSELITEYVPGSDDSPLDSDVAAWRLAWKLAQVYGNSEKNDEKCMFFNIYVCDDLGNPVCHYATGKPEKFNSQPC